MWQKSASGCHVVSGDEALYGNKRWGAFIKAESSLTSAVGIEKLIGESILLLHAAAAVRSTRAAAAL
jgi:hypothetical protein